MRRILALLGALAVASRTRAACDIPADAAVVVYAATGWGGVGEFSDKWTRAFFAWFAAPNPSLVVSFVTDAAQLADYPRAAACALSAFESLVLYVQPGGSADNASASLGPGGRDNILDFAASPRGHFMGTCAGFYYVRGVARAACARTRSNDAFFLSTPRPRAARAMGTLKR